MRKKPREPAKGTRSHVNEIQAARNSVARRAVCGSSPQDDLRLTKPIGLRRCFAVSPLSTHCYRIPSTARTPLVAIGFDLGLDLLYRHRRDIGSGECRHRLAQLLDMLARKVPATSIRSLRASVIRPPVPLRGGGCAGTVSTPVSSWSVGPQLSASIHKGTRRLPASIIFSYDRHVRSSVVGMAREKRCYYERTRTVRGRHLWANRNPATPSGALRAGPFGLRACGR
jgi:hypothetical protein